MKENKNLILTRAKLFAHFCTLTFSAENVMGKGIRSAFGCIVGRASSYGASDEHPMSTRSASDGTTRRTRLVPHITAVFMLLFFVGIGNAWGTDYYKIRVVAVSAEGGETNGLVYACAYSSWNSVKNDPTIWKSDNTTGPWTEMYDSHPDIYLCAKDVEPTSENPGAFFLGWYKDEECQNHVQYSYAYKISEQYSSASSHMLTSTVEEDAPVTTFYALFTSVPSTTYYAKLVYEQDARKRGAFKKGSWSAKYYFDYGSTTDSQETRTGSATINYSVATLRVRRGYVFDHWEIEGENIDFNSSYNAYSKFPYVHINTTSSNSASPEEGIIRVVYDTCPEYTLTIQKAKTKGKVTVSYRNYFMNAGGDQLVENTVNLADVAVNESSQSYRFYNSDKLTITAIPESGYEFHGWYIVDENGDKTLYQSGASISSLTNNGGDGTLYAHFAKAYTDDDKFVVGQVVCQNLDQAIEAATSSSNKTILQVNDYTVPAGSYTIPEGITLLVPYAEEQDEAQPTIERTSNSELPTGAYKTLTLAEGAHLNVYGTIEVGGRQSTGSAGAGGDVGVGRPAAPTYGHMILNEGSSITLNNNAIFRAWGYVTGAGEIDARRGSTVYEQFQVMDWRGYDYTMRVLNGNHKVLPLTQYYIQNIESPTKYHPGARLLGCTGVRISQSIMTIVVKMDDAGIIGVRYEQGTGKQSDKAIFLMDDEDDSDDTWVRKYYDPATDQQVYEANNSTYLGSLVMNLEALGYNVIMNSAEYELPITNNFKIHLKNGNLVVTQNTIMLPGSEIELDKKSTVTIPDTATLYLYDTDQWGTYVCKHWNSATSYTFGYGTRVKYRPGGVPVVRDIDTKDGQGDAKLTVHGTVDVQGKLFTTESGASITSTIADAGTVIFTNAAPTFSTNHYVEQVSSTTPTFVRAQCVSGLLSNESGSAYGTFAQTAGTAAGQSFCFIDIDGDGKGEWKSLTTSDCFTYDETGVYYIKPGAYVPISVGKPVPEADHTYRDHYAETGKIYIMAADGNCQWWEVEAVEGQSNLFECKHPDNHTFYYYDDDESSQSWLEKKFKVSWQNWNGDPVNYTDAEGNEVNYYYVSYGTVPQWLSANPSRTDDASHTYSFSGWLPTPAAVTEDVVYVAQYEERDRMYAVSFYNKESEGGDLIELVYCKLGEIPVCTNHTLASNEEWTPALSAVISENQTYTLQDKPVKSNYTITWKNWNGDIIRTDEAQTTMPACPDYPTKADDASHSYAFKAWQPAPLAAGTALDADAVYTATYTAGPKNYTIKFYQENGETQIGETQSVAYGAMPAVPEYSKAATDEKTYTLVWSPLVSAATQNQDYRATFTEQARQYTVTWKNYDGSTITTDYVDYGATPEYSGLVPTKPEDETYVYNFSGWDPVITAVNGNATYTAQFTQAVKQTSLNVTSTSSKTAEENEVVQADDLTIEVGGTLDMNATGSKVITDNLVLKADASGSGQLIATNAQVKATNAYYDLYLNTNARHWHAFGVPWAVDVNANPLIEVETGRQLIVGRDCEIVWYNGATRAAQGAGSHCWEYLKHYNGDGSVDVMTPGKGYMIAFASHVGTVRFAKATGTPVIFGGSNSVTGGIGDDGGWNAIANPMAYHATLNAGPTVGYVHDGGEIGNDGYTAYDINDKRFVVGKMVYVQARADASVVVNPAGSAGDFVLAAPQRRTKAAAITEKQYLSLDDYYTVSLTDANAVGSKVYVQAEEDKTDEYVIGHDLSQFGMNATKAQVWVNRYDTKLALNTTAPVNGVAEFPISVYVPKTGEYTMSSIEPSAISGQNDYVVYLTENGAAIWNLSESAYTLTLDKGTHAQYGVRLSAKAPQITTGIDEAVVDAQGETKKVLINDKVYIIRGEKVYSVDGQLVK